MMYKANKSDRLSSQLAHILPVAVVQFVDVFTDTGIVVTLYIERGIESIEFWAAVSFMALSIIITYCYALSISPSRGIRRALMLLFAVPLNLHMLIFGIEVVDEQREELKRETAGALLEKKQHLGEMKVIETCLESTALAIITTTMICREAAQVLTPAVPQLRPERLADAVDAAHVHKARRVLGAQ